MTDNWNCDGSGPHSAGTVKLYPLGGGANLILCHKCWKHENHYRMQRGTETRNPANWPVLNWDDSETYKTS